MARVYKTHKHAIKHPKTYIYRQSHVSVRNGNSRKTGCYSSKVENQKEKGWRNAPPKLKKMKKKEPLRPEKKKNKKHEQDESKKKVVLKCSSLDNLLGKLKIFKRFSSQQQEDGCPLGLLRGIYDDNQTTNFPPHFSTRTASCLPCKLDMTSFLEWTN
ncbi:hypothetical protein PIB30_025283 [Stylosanthes scabra]|uniref:Uncharacterized protein n=1 Tax=Stylosanthes scabra TaxID=79078 RepID=A0ABU6UCS7_9FABA|nr:hypothetical protein [Stylosanthes scabra]